MSLKSKNSQSGTVALNGVTFASATSIIQAAFTPQIHSASISVSGGTFNQPAQFNWTNDIVEQVKQQNTLESEYLIVGCSTESKKFITQVYKAFTRKDAAEMFRKEHGEHFKLFITAEYDD